MLCGPFVVPGDLAVMHTDLTSVTGFGSTKKFTNHYILTLTTDTVVNLVDKYCIKSCSIWKRDENRIFLNPLPVFSCFYPNGMTGDKSSWNCNNHCDISTLQRAKEFPTFFHEKSVKHRRMNILAFHEYRLLLPLKLGCLILFIRILKLICYKKKYQRPT